ncbi:MscS Mechanosensitive ion channel [Methanohalobium evestigatum Z-7303]|uniref:MscS Mechanosensitive ion channel n=1 Tax=Methanohalobium evestigatum (strain ATCC BAA-1072 / DSM 3721 / NBRC 107634 / OCM 161 / Z-7303) TaxID=644295 RepID=D7E6K4_METEZ|nr:mechanosensitive ion channel family protein [Methanohalobium evestigatum]ADI73226.1 MscS Mechanosensitive ion channel [Methanohalobium evestigatum Z-7303]
MNLEELYNYIFQSGEILIKIFSVVIFILIALFISKIITVYLRRYFKDKIAPSRLNVFLKLIYYSIITVTIGIFILPIVGIQPSSLLVAGGIVGIVIGFASQSIVGNLISGIFLIVERPIKIGNQVNIDNNIGIVEDINLISTIIRTFDGLYIRIPNEKVFTNNITNYVANVARRFEYIVGIRYSDDAEQAIDIIKDLIEKEPLALKHPESLVFVDNLGNNAVNLSVRIWAPATEWFSLRTSFLWKIKTTLEDNGIEIAFPQRTVWFANQTQGEEYYKKNEM